MRLLLSTSSLVLVKTESRTAMTCYQMLAFCSFEYTNKILRLSIVNQVLVSRNQRACPIVLASQMFEAKID